MAPPVHMKVHIPLEHTWSRPHALPQAPQCSRLVMSDAQLRPPALVQSISPAVQSGTHAPF